MKTENFFQLRPNERILEVVHEDFVPALPWWIFLFIWIVGPFFFLFPLIQRGPEGVVFLFGLIGFGVLMAWRARFVWQRTVLIITDQRVIDASQRGFFDQTTTEVELRDIEEVSFHVKGFWSTVFRYGPVYLRTAGERADLVFRRVHRPIELYRLLNELIKICR